MTQFKSILFSTDFSVCAEHAREYAFALAKNSKATLYIVHVIDTTSLYAAGLEVPGAVVARTVESISGHARQDLDKAVQLAKLQGIDAQAHLLTGRAPEDVVELAEDLDCGLIVIGSHGRSGFSKLVFGSVCEKMVRLSHVPVLTIKHPEHDFVEKGALTELKRVLCPCDFSGFSDAGIGLAASLCRQFGATLVFTHVVDERMDYPLFGPDEGPLNSPRARQDALNSLRDLADEYSDIATEINVATGIPEREIVRAVKEENIDLVVMATHGRTGIAHALLGSTAQRVVRRAPCPVLTVGPLSTVSSQTAGA